MKVALVGCGHIAEAHLRSLRKTRGVTVAAVCDRDLDRARTFATRHGLRNAFEDTPSMIEAVNPDVVHVLTPPGSHVGVVADAAGPGRSLLVEKPLAIDGNEARTAVRLASEQGAILSVCHNYLFMPAIRRARRIVERGDLGTITSADAFWRATSLDGPARGNATWAEDLPGGPFHEVAPHPVYLLAAFLGDLDVVSAVTSRLHESENELRVTFRGERGPGTFTIALGGEPVRKQLRINGSRMSLLVDVATNVLVRLRPWGAGAAGRATGNIDQSMQLLAGTGANVARSLVGRMPRTHVEFLEAYYRALERGDPPPVSGESGLETVRILDRVWTTRAGRDA